MATEKEALKIWDEHSREVQSSTLHSLTETPAQKEQRINTLRGDYNKFFKYYFPKYCGDGSIDCAPFQIKAANTIAGNDRIKYLAEWYRGSAKTTHLTMGIPMWLMFQRVPDLGLMMLIAKNESIAERLLMRIQVQLAHNQRLIHDFGVQRGSGNWTDGFFMTRSGVGFLAMGIGQAPRGTLLEEKRPDYVVTSDLDDEELSFNENRVQEHVEWIFGSLLPMMTHYGRFVNECNGWAPKGIMKTLIQIMPKSPNWVHHRVDALDENGMSTWPSNYSQEYWREKEADTLPSKWLSEYMNEPVLRGATFKAEWIKWKPMPRNTWHEYDFGLLSYGDPGFKNTIHSDHKAIWLIARKGEEIHLLKSFNRKAPINEMAECWYDINDRVPDNATAAHWMEGNFLQDLLLDEFVRVGKTRGYQLRLMPDKRSKPNKEDRIEQLVPLFARGFIYFNELEKEDPDMKRSVEHLLAWSRKAKTPDDSPDALEGAIFKLEENSRSSSADIVVGLRERSKRMP